MRYAIRRVDFLVELLTDVDRNRWRERRRACVPCEIIVDADVRVPRIRRWLAAGSLGPESQRTLCCVHEEGG